MAHDRLQAGERVALPNLRGLKSKFGRRAILNLFFRGAPAPVSGCTFEKSPRRRRLGD
jgi:hypothetical protein